MGAVKVSKKAKAVKVEVKASARTGNDAKVEQMFLDAGVPVGSHSRAWKMYEMLKARKLPIGRKVVVSKMGMKTAKGKLETYIGSSTRKGLALLGKMFRYSTVKVEKKNEAGKTLEFSLTK